MGAVLQFKKVESEAPSMTGPAHCINCKHEWEAVAPMGTVELECPNCHAHKGIFSMPCFPESGEVWQCSCGNHFFLITKQGHLCPNCGAHQSYD